MQSLINAFNTHNYRHLQIFGKINSSSAAPKRPLTRGEPPFSQGLVTQPSDNAARPWEGEKKNALKLYQNKLGKLSLTLWMLSCQWEDSKSSGPPTRVYTTKNFLKGDQSSDLQMSVSFCTNISLFPPCQKCYFKLPGNYCELAGQQLDGKEQFLSYLCTLLTVSFAQEIPWHKYSLSLRSGSCILCHSNHSWRTKMERSDIFISNSVSIKS